MSKRPSPMGRHSSSKTSPRRSTQLLILFSLVPSIRRAGEQSNFAAASCLTHSCVCHSMLIRNYCTTGLTCIGCTTCTVQTQVRIESIDFLCLTHTVHGNSPTTFASVLSCRSLFLKVGGEEVEYDPGFQLYLQTKLSNPHYKPEIAAQV